MPEEAFDRIVRVAARTLRVPIAIVNFVDEHRQWGKAIHGTGSTEAPREHSFCAWTILSDDVTVVENAHEDPRFRDHPMVTGAPHIHLYAGAPLITPDGDRLGTLCVVSPEPRELRGEDRAVLRELAAMVVDELELRRTRRELEREVAVRERALRDLTENRAHTETLAVLLASLEVDLLPVEAARLTAEHVARQAGLDWVALAAAGEGRVAARTVWHAPGVPGALLHTARQGVPPGSLTERVLSRGAPLFVDDLTGGPLADLGVRTVAALPLGRVDDVPHVYLAARLRPRPWSAADRQLLEAAASSVRVAFERAERAPA
nr:GAF domain-containing protein [Deinococcus aestuarii]